MNPRRTLMAKPFKTLVDRMSPEAKRTVAQKTQQLLKELSVQRLRRARLEKGSI
jgi:hypothetical protein